MQKLAISRYTINNQRFDGKIKYALVSDLHSGKKTDIEPIIKALKDNSPDCILMPGDIFERLDGSRPEGKTAGYELIKRAAEIAPVYYSIGNHENGGTGSWNMIKWRKSFFIEKYFEQSELDKIFDCGATFLDDGFVIEDGIAYGGLTSGLINKERKPHVDWLDEFCKLECPKVLLCHHPEYYKKYLKGKNIDLIVAGHAHGGQWRFFGRGVFAPGQGIFPKYTSGVHDGRLVISRGLKPSGKIPRIFNTPEIVFIEINNS